MAAALGAPAVAGAAEGRGRRAGQPLDTTRRRARRRAPRCSPGGTSPQHGVTTTSILPMHTRARPRDPHRRLAARRRRLPQRATSASGTSPGGADAAMDGVRLRRLGGQRPALHGLGRHRACTSIRSSRRTRRPGGCVPTARQDRALVPHGRAREPARRHVVPDRPARATRTIPRTPTRSTLVEALLDAVEVEGRRGAAAVHDGRTTRSCDDLPANFDDDLLDKPDDASGSGAGTSSTACGATSTRATTRAWLSPPRLLRQAPPAGRRPPRHRARRARAQRRLGRHRRRSSRPTTATCAGRTACAARGRSSTRRSCTCRAT